MLVILFVFLSKLTASQYLNFTIAGESPALQCSLCNTSPMDPAGKQCYKKCLVFLGLNKGQNFVKLMSA